jgi:hypothetical protein
MHVSRFGAVFGVLKVFNSAPLLAGSTVGLPNDHLEHAFLFTNASRRLRGRRFAWVFCALFLSELPQ